MNTSLEQIKHDPKEENDKSKRKIKNRLPRVNKPAWSVIWRVLLVCAMIDLPIWAYFHFVKEVSFWEGVRQVRNEIQNKINSPEQKIPQKIEKIEITEKNIEKIQKNNEIKLVEPKKFEGTLYSWKNEKGQRVFSNTGFPKDGKYTDGKIEMQ